MKKKNRKICSKYNYILSSFRAKSNVDKHFVVVALLEDMEKSLVVLEHYLPRFFRGVSDVYRQYMEKSRKGRGVNANLYKPKKPKTWQQIKDTLAANFTKEIDFYEYCRARLHKQYLTLVKH